MAWTVFVLDSSALIRIKHDFTPGQQWRVCEQIKALVENGRASFPKQVHAEVAGVHHPDAPGAVIGALHDAHAVQFPEPSDATVAEVLRAHPNLHDWDAPHDQADAYVVAQAVELSRSEGLRALVVSHDRVNRPDKTSVAAACTTFAIECISLSELLEIAAEADPVTYADWLDDQSGQWTVLDPGDA